jgi:site-specific DNA recombinase
MTIRPDRVAVYIRWSTDDQAEGTTAAVQRETCRHYVLSQGWQFREELLFVDDGCSGGSLDRPALNRLRLLIRKGQIDCVVLFKIDRLSRNLVDTVNLVLREWEGRCHVRSAREAIDTTTPGGKMFFYTLVSFAEWERAVIRDRTLSGKLRRLREGKNPGFRPPYGFRRGAETGRFAVVPAEAPVVRQIFRLYLRGLGYSAIAAWLRRQGVCSRGGRPFTGKAVAAVLANPLYAGTLLYGRRSRRGRAPALPKAESVAGAAWSLLGLPERKTVLGHLLSAVFAFLATPGRTLTCDLHWSGTAEGEAAEGAK